MAGVAQPGRDQRGAASRIGVAGQETAAGEHDQVRFPVANAGAEIDTWRREVSEGRGLQVVSGVPVHGWSVEESSAFFWGLGQHLGLPGAQNRNGDLLGHVRDTGADKVDRYVRQYLTTQNIPFHCDAADMVGLLCLRKAKSGGLSRIASSVSVYNELLRRRPDLAPRLFEPFMLDTRDEAEANGMKVLPVPPCRHAAGALRTFWHAEYFRTSQRHEGVRLTDVENELFDLYDEISASPEFFINMDLEPGDVQLLSNHTVIHARTDYVDHVEPDPEPPPAAPVDHVAGRWTIGSTRLSGAAPICGPLRPLQRLLLASTLLPLGVFQLSLAARPDLAARTWSRHGRSIWRTFSFPMRVPTRCGWSGWLPRCRPTAGRSGGTPRCPRASNSTT